MTFAQTQIALGLYRPRKLDPVQVRKKHLCPRCAKVRRKSKMDYLGNQHFKHNLCVYNVDFYKCAACGFVDRAFFRIEGRGKSGVNLGKLWGGK